MPDLPDPRITRMYDTSRLRQGTVAEVTVVEFHIADFGPFTVDVPRGASASELRDAMRARAAALYGNV